MTYAVGPFDKENYSQRSCQLNVPKQHFQKYFNAFTQKNLQKSNNHRIYYVDFIHFFFCFEVEFIYFVWVQDASP